MNNFSPNTQFTLFPPVIKNLLITISLAFLATVSLFGSSLTPIGEFAFRYLALYPIGSGNFYPWQLVTYIFLHGGLGHIFFNLFALWIFGQSIEKLWGSKRFLIYFFVTGIGAGLFQLWLAGGGNAPTIGASGAVFGILLAFGMMYPDRYIVLLIPPIPIKAKYFVAIYGAFELFAGISNPYGGIARFAHVGGLVVGFILIKFWKLKKPQD
ncbi:MAG: rhomboid family intramembrane serine protease [Gracilimonas sp.]|uniref:rhomboid family intramembrane serine protease n=1 Tax=Gracilimonas sp. TaxID=1974203 RepID=UPI003751C9EF|nr:rhomboid family intramembrane serine protease [Gracilimonas sp.]